MTTRFYLGIILFLLSYLQYLLPIGLANFEILSLLMFSFIIGIILICEGITMKIRNQSLLNLIVRSRRSLIIFLLISTVGGLGLDAVAQWLGKLWFYQYIVPSKFLFYLFLYSIGFASYWLMIAESYFAAKLILDYLHKGKKIVTKYYRFEKTLYPVLGVIGAALIPIGIFFVFEDYSRQGGYTFNLYQPASYQINFGNIMLIFLGVWFLFEFIEYVQRKTSLLKDIIHRYPNPLLAIFIASSFLAILMETQNLPHDYWVYLNWPFQNLKLFGLPLLMFLAWPIHYIAFLSFFRVTAGKLSEDVLDGDAIP